MQRRGGEAGAARRKWLPRWDLSVSVLVREAVGGRPKGRRRRREEEEELVGTGAPASAEEEKETGGAERGGDGGRRGRHHGASPALTSLSGAAHGGDALPQHQLQPPVGLRLEPAAGKRQPRGSAPCGLR